MRKILPAFVGVLLLFSATIFADDGSSVDQAKMDAAYARLREKQASASQPVEQPSPLQKQIDVLSEGISRLEAENEEALAHAEERSKMIDKLREQLTELQAQAHAAADASKPAALGPGVTAPADQTAAVKQPAPRPTPSPAPEVLAVPAEPQADPGQIRGAIIPSGSITAADSANLAVFLLKPTVSREALAQCLKSNIRRLDELADHEDGLIDQIKETLPDFAREHTQKAKHFREMSIRASEAMMQLREATATLSAYDLLKESAYPVPNFAPAVADALVLQTKADSAGRYSFTDMPDGVYILYAKIDTTTNFTEWLIPLRLKGGGVEMDLTLGNASVNKQN